MAPKIWRRLAKNRQKTGYLLPLSSPRLFNLEACYLYHLKALGLKLCPAKFQADRAKNLAEIGENPLKHVILCPYLLCATTYSRGFKPGSIPAKSNFFSDSTTVPFWSCYEVGDYNSLGVTCFFFISRALPHNLVVEGLF